MYLEKCTIRNIKCFEDVTLDFRQPDGSIRLWNVLIGENGTGKSTLLQAIAIALAGQKAASVLLPRPRGWVRAGAEVADIEATILPGSGDSEVGWSSEVGRRGRPVQARYTIIDNNRKIDGTYYDGPTIVGPNGPDRHRLEQIQSPKWPGWFAAGYGPFRRLGNGADHISDIQLGNKEARFITLFREGVALTRCTEWLMELDYARRDDSNPEQQQSSADLLELVRETLNTRLLPERFQLDTINSQGVFLRTPYADKVPISDLSDGYRAMLAMAIDLIRHLSQVDEALRSLHPQWLLHVPGVVLIDELDAHLHPTWQREIGSWLKDRFPSVQFIVATHSPFIAQVADDNGLYILRPSASHSNTVQAHVDETSVRGWRADQILSILFDTPSVYDPETEDRLREYGRLKILSDMGRLPEDQAQNFTELQAWLDKYLAPPGDTRAEMQHSRDVKRRGQEVSKMLRERRSDDKG